MLLLTVLTLFADFAPVLEAEPEATALDGIDSDGEDVERVSIDTAKLDDAAGADLLERPDFEDLRSLSCVEDVVGSCTTEYLRLLDIETEEVGREGMLG